MLRSFGQFLRDAVIGGLLSLPTVRRMTSGGTKFSVAAVSAEITRIVENRIARYFGDAINDSFSNEMFGTLRSVDGPLDVPPEKLWVPERDACRHCLAYAGEFEKLNEGFAEGLTFGDKPLTPSAWGGGQIRKPPVHPHCVIPSTRVSANGVSSVSDRHYAGEVVTIQTRSGKELTATPNHPVLTPSGWVGAGELEEGDDVVSHLGKEWPLPGLQHHKKMPARIQDVARAFSKSSAMVSVEVPVSPEHFHGDGAGSEVARVRADRLLWEGGQAPMFQEFRKFGLSVGVVPSLQLPSLGGGGLRLEGLRSSSDSIVGGSGETRSTVSALPGHANSVGLASTSGLDARLSEPTPERGTLDSELSGEGEFALSRDVAVDPVVSIRRWDYAGHVMNLETRSGWYLAEGIVTHNCRCDIVPYDSARDIGPVTQAEALKREAQRSILRGWALDSESQPARLRAAERLLRADPAMPATVKDIARRALRRGGF